MTTIQLTATQHAILAHATESTNGQIDWFPDTVNGGARQKVLAGLANRGLAIQGDGAWRATPAAYVALGRPEPEAPGEGPTPDLEADVATAEATFTPPAEAPRRRTRDNTKQATLIAMLRRPEGATIPQMSSALDWQPHTVRGTLAGALKKKLGLTLVSEKTAGTDRVYRISA